MRFDRPHRPGTPTHVFHGGLLAFVQRGHAFSFKRHELSSNFSDVNPELRPNPYREAPTHPRVEGEPRGMGEGRTRVIQKVGSAIL